VKLLFDHHVSPALVSRLRDLFPDSEHVWNVGLHEAPDIEVWWYARVHGFIVISKDADFSEISMQHGFPPKLVWLRLGNCTTDDVEDLLRSKYLWIAELEQSAERGILVLFSRDAR
jgi:predicted nuclease of predicted toxin-antitoxin system